MHVIIPARYASTRLPGKPLLDIGGKPLIQHVYERAVESGAQTVIIATDDERIRTAAERFGATVCMTAPTHASGTDRIGEVIGKHRLKPDEIVVNLQGDEPLMPPDLIQQVAQTLARHVDAAMATAAHAIDDVATLNNPNVVKVVCDARGYALYFSRAAIPWPGKAAATAAPTAQRHIGLYAYRAGFITRFCAWGPSPLEQIEQLEQLRALWHGERIVVSAAAAAPESGVDTPADLERVRAQLETRDRTKRK